MTFKFAQLYLQYDFTGTVQRTMKTNEQKELL